MLNAQVSVLSDVKEYYNFYLFMFIFCSKGINSSTTFINRLRRTRSLGTTPSDHPTTMEALHVQRLTNHRDYG